MAKMLNFSQPAVIEHLLDATLCWTPQYQNGDRDRALLCGTYLLTVRQTGKQNEQTNNVRDDENNSEQSKVC